VQVNRKASHPTKKFRSSGFSGQIEGIEPRSNEHPVTLQKDSPQKYPQTSASEECK
jgi:hypothetical protein